MKLTSLRDRVRSITSESLADDVLEIRNEVACYAEAVKEIQGLLKQATIDWIDEHGNIPIGDGRRLYVAKVKQVRCRNVNRTFEAVMHAIDGDVSRIADYLTLQPFKQGACSGILSMDTWSSLFDIQYPIDLKTGATKWEIRTSLG